MRFPAAFLAIVLFIFSSCGNDTAIDSSDASEVIHDHLEAQPEFKTASFSFGELKFRAIKDREELAKYKELESQGYIEMTLDEQKKVFLSRDSTYTYRVRMTEKAAPLVLDQGRSQARVKVLNYILDEQKPVQFVKNGKTAKATVILKAEPTPFYPFMSKKEPDSDFITKTFRLKLKDKSVWTVSP